MAHDEGPENENGNNRDFVLLEFGRNFTMEMGLGGY